MHYSSKRTWYGQVWLTVTVAYDYNFTGIRMSPTSSFEHFYCDWIGHLLLRTFCKVIMAWINLFYRPTFPWSRWLQMNVSLNHAYSTKCFVFVLSFHVSKPFHRPLTVSKRHRFSVGHFTTRLMIMLRNWTCYNWTWICTFTFKNWFRSTQHQRQ